MKAKSILFSGEMVRAILEGRKTQTRRVAKTGGDNCISMKIYNEKYPKGVMCRNHILDARSLEKCPYGKVGDLLWVRETFCPEHSAFMQETGNIYYRATDGESLPFSHKWKPSIFMPKHASRITLEIIDIRVERLQDISESDCRAEGRGNGGKPYGWFKLLWDSINGKYPAKSWQANPWVWVIEFAPHFVNVNAMREARKQGGEDE